MSHHYDAHDQDKLLRWQDELRANPPADNAFPALALFLVRPADTAAHEIFRRYRAEFEPRGASFAQISACRRGRSTASPTARESRARTSGRSP